MDLTVRKAAAITAGYVAACLLAALLIVGPSSLVPVTVIVIAVVSVPCLWLRVLLELGTPWGTRRTLVTDLLIFAAAGALNAGLMILLLGGPSEPPLSVLLIGAVAGTACAVVERIIAHCYLWFVRLA